MLESKIKQYLNEMYFSWVIIDSLSKEKIVSFMSRGGIIYPGVRMDSLAHEELAYDLAEEAFGHQEIMHILVKVLNEHNQTEIDAIAGMSEGQVKDLLVNPSDIFPSRKIGKLVWALLCDSRPLINDAAKKVLHMVNEQMNAQKSLVQARAKEAQRAASGTFSKKGHKKLLDTISNLKEQITKYQNLCRALSKDNVNLNHKNAEQQGAIKDLRRLSGEFTLQKGILNKQIARQERDIESLSAQISELKKRLDVGPKMRLKSEIHRLQKDNDQLNYRLEKEHQAYADKICGLEKELSQVKTRLITLEEENSRIRQQLEMEKAKYEDIEKKYQAAVVKKEEAPPVPKEKGRRLGIFIDNQNVYYSARTHFGKKINYQKLLETLVRGRHLVKALCYIVQQAEGSQEGFIHLLQNSGYTVRVRDLIRRADGSAKGNWDIGIAADVITMVEKNSLDVVVLVTCDGDFVDLIKLLSAKGIKVEVVGFTMNMAMDLKKTADEYYFITDELMLPV